MTRRLTVIQPHEIFDFPSNEEELSNSEKPITESDENFYEAFNYKNLAMFWVVIMLLSYILAFTLAILVILSDQNDKFLAYHKDENFTAKITNGTFSNGTS